MIAAPPQLHITDYTSAEIGGQTCSTSNPCTSCFIASPARSVSIPDDVSSPRFANDLVRMVRYEVTMGQVEDESVPFGLSFVHDPSKQFTKDGARFHLDRVYVVLTDDAHCLCALFQMVYPSRRLALFEHSLMVPPSFFDPLKANATPHFGERFPKELLDLIFSYALPACGTELKRLAEIVTKMATEEDQIKYGKLLACDTITL